MCRTVSRFAEYLNITVKHGQELYRVQFLAVKCHFHVQVISADSNRLTSFYLLSETDEHVDKTRVGHLVLAIACDKIYTAFLIIADT